MKADICLWGINSEARNEMGQEEGEGSNCKQIYGVGGECDGRYEWEVRWTGRSVRGGEHAALRWPREEVALQVTRVSVCGHHVRFSSCIPVRLRGRHAARVQARPLLAARVPFPPCALHIHH